MPRPCSVCVDGRRPEIDAAIARGVPLRELQGRYGMSRSTLSRHKSHIINAIQRVAVSREQVTAAVVMGQFEALKGRAEKLLDASEKDKNYRSAIAAVRTLHELIQSVADLAGVREGPQAQKVVGARFSLYREQELNDEVEAGVTAIDAA